MKPGILTMVTRCVFTFILITTFVFIASHASAKQITVAAMKKLNDECGAAVSQIYGEIRKTSQRNTLAHSFTKSWILRNAAETKIKVNKGTEWKVDIPKEWGTNRMKTVNEHLNEAIKKIKAAKKTCKKYEKLLDARHYVLVPAK